jgi:hypothetical protein
MLLVLLGLAAMLGGATAKSACNIVGASWIVPSNISVEHTNL